ncbi:MAG: hypothetical protein LM571_01805 [Desulfurococcaceae archaeon]|jgi:DNA-directed RNA polymerase subunit RPC12/RpoP|nr:hypothetical protein [Desulfurococcaceae archaeon]
MSGVYYKCWVCGEQFDKRQLEPFSERAAREGYAFIRCPKCGSKLVVKMRKSAPARVEAV